MLPTHPTLSLYATHPPTHPPTRPTLQPWDYSVCPDPDSDAPSCRVYAVQSGDFVFGIASIFRVTVGALLEVNPGLAVDTYLQSGMRLRIRQLDFSGWGWIWVDAKCLREEAVGRYSAWQKQSVADVGQTPPTHPSSTLPPTPFPQPHSLLHAATVRRTGSVGVLGFVVLLCVAGWGSTWVPTPISTSPPNNTQQASWPALRPLAFSPAAPTV